MPIPRRVSGREGNRRRENAARGALELRVGLPRERPRREPRMREQRPLRGRLLRAHGVVDLIGGDRCGGERAHHDRYGRPRPAHACQHGRVVEVRDRLRDGGHLTRRLDAEPGRQMYSDV